MSDYSDKLELWAKRRRQIADEYKPEEGVTLESLARKWRISRQRIKQIIKKSLERDKQ